MNNVLVYIESNIMCIILLAILFFYNIKHERTYKKTIKTIYILTFTASVTDTLKCLSYGNLELIPLTHMFSAIYLTCFGFIAYFWFLYCAKRYNIKYCDSPLFRLLSAIPVIVVSMLIVTSFKTGLIYQINSTGEYVRGRLFPLLLVNYVYIIGVWIFALTAIRKVSLDRKRYEYVSMAVLTIPAVVIGFAQILFLKQGLSLMPYSVFIALFMLFISTQYQTIRIDNLTKLHNRYGMNDEIKKQLDQYKKDKTDLFYMIACDIDDFKHINDTWGHLEGDRALVLVSDVLAHISEEYNSVAFRIGGDEFVIIVDTSDSVLIKELCTKLEDALLKIDFRDDYDIKMSMGFAIYDGKTDIDELLNFADMQLYSVKRKKKQKK